MRRMIFHTLVTDRPTPKKWKILLETKENWVFMRKQKFALHDQVHIEKKISEKLWGYPENSKKTSDFFLNKIIVYTTDDSI